MESGSTAVGIWKSSKGNKRQYNTVMRLMKEEWTGGGLETLV